MYEENIEWIFNQDCRDKKRTGNGIHGRAARLRKKEAVKMPSERETDKFQRKIILGAGPCYVTTLREMKLLELLDRVKNKQQITIDDIKELPVKDGLEIYTELRRMYGIEELQKALECSLEEILELSTIFNLDWMKRTQYGEWITVSELKDLEFKEGQKIYAELRRLYTTADMYKGFSCSSAQISELSYHFQVARKGKMILVGEQALDVLRGFTENRMNQASVKREKDEQEVITKAKETTTKRKYNRKPKEDEEINKAPSQMEIQTISDTVFNDPIPTPEPIQEVIPVQEISPSQITLVEVKNTDIDLLRISVKNVYNSEQIKSFLTRIQLFVEGQENQFELSLTLQEKMAT